MKRSDYEAVAIAVNKRKVFHKSRPMTPIQRHYYQVELDAVIEALVDQFYLLDPQFREVEFRKMIHS